MERPTKSASSFLESPSKKGRKITFTRAVDDDEKEGLYDEEEEDEEEEEDSE